MKDMILGLLLGIVIGTAYSAYAKYESGSTDAASVVAYGYTSSGTLTAIKCADDGTIALSGS